MPEGPYFFAVDLGAGFGAKLALAGAPGGALLAEASLPRSRFGNSYAALLDGLAGEWTNLASAFGAGAPAAAGLASPGIFTSEGSYLVTSGFDFLNGKNLRADLEKALACPVGIENDANAGALAEWSRMRADLLYWVFGGGWGGAWVNAAGRILHSSVDWDGIESHLHLSNEPGFATPLTKAGLAALFEEEGFDFRMFLENLEKEGREVFLRGPGNDESSLRAEVLVSGTGIFRIFKAHPQSTRPAYAHIRGAATAGKWIDELAEKEDGAALQTYRLFGRLLGRAGARIIGQAIRDGASACIPVHLAGKPARAFRFFASHAVGEWEKAGIKNPLRLSPIFESGANANLIGAAVLARRVWESKNGVSE